MTDELIKQLLEAGVHFGHQTKRWNPKMKQFIFGERSGIYIIDLEKTVDCLNRARDFLKEVAAGGGSILYIGTKKQAQDVIEQEAKRAGIFYVNRRWLGGLLTNFATIRKSINRMKDIERMHTDGTFENLKKKEVASLNKEKETLAKNLSGIRDMVHLPKAIFMIDSKKEEIAVEEGRRLGIPIVGLIDTNCDPDKINFPIAGNDDAMRSIKLIASLVTDSVVEGKRQFEAGKIAQEAKKEEEARAESDEKGEAGEEIEIAEEVEKDGEKKQPSKAKTHGRKDKSETKEE